MTIELQMLALSIVLGLIHVILNASTATTQYGLDWNTGPRDTPMPPLQGVGGRLQRALHNFVETFPFFAAAVMIAHVAGRHSALTHWGVLALFLGTGGVSAALRLRHPQGPVGGLGHRDAWDYPDPGRPSVVVLDLAAVGS